MNEHWLYVILPEETDIPKKMIFSSATLYTTGLGLNSDLICGRWTTYCLSRSTKFLNLSAPKFFFYFSTPCIQNVNNTGTKYLRIMKQTAF